MTFLLDSCCCGCSVRTGTKIIGWFSMIGAVCTIALGVVAAGFFAVSMEVEKHRQASLKSERTTVSSDLGLYIILGAALYLLIVGTIQAVVTGIMLHGVNKKRPHLLKPWIVYSIIQIVIQGIGMLLYIVGAFASGQLGMALMRVVISPCIILIAIYYVSVVNSHRRELTLNNMSSKI